MATKQAKQQTAAFHLKPPRLALAKFTVKVALTLATGLHLSDVVESV